MNKIRRKTEPTVEIRIYIAGDLNLIENTCREYCWNKGFCVTVTPTNFIYTGGEEAGACIGIVNYPRFPSDVDVLEFDAEELAILLIERCFQTSALIICPDETIWLTRRDDK